MTLFCSFLYCLTREEISWPYREAALAPYVEEAPVPYDEVVQVHQSIPLPGLFSELGAVGVVVLVLKA